MIPRAADAVRGSLMSSPVVRDLHRSDIDVNGLRLVSCLTCGFKTPRNLDADHGICAVCWRRLA